MLISSVFLAAHRDAQGIDLFVRSPHTGPMRDLFFSGATATNPSSGYINLKFNISCFSTNLRSVVNPISPTATIKANIGIGTTSNPVTKSAQGDFYVLFPGWIAMNRTQVANSPQNRDEVFPVYIGNRGGANFPLAGAIGYGVQNTVSVKIPLNLVSLSGSNNHAKKVNSIRYINFAQDLQAKGKCWGKDAPNSTFQQPPWIDSLVPKVWAGGGIGGVHEFGFPEPNDNGWGQETCASAIPGWGFAGLTPAQAAMYRSYYSRYMGHDGPLSGSWRGNWSSDYSTFVIDASFPGEAGFCGGWFSPLILFTESSIPEFKSYSQFEISPGVFASHWPEPESGAGFLTLDLNQNGRIDNHTELFGADDEFKNGFEKLRKYDLDRNGLINARDPVFSRLLVWKDRTGKGQSKSEDLWTLDQLGITEIHLDYRIDQNENLGNRAQLRERSLYKYRSRQGVIKKGSIVDVWLSP